MLPISLEVQGYAKIARQLEGIYCEVVVADVYRIRRLDFVPTVIIDVGANVGFFTRFARELYNKATIISVEPDPFNFAVLAEVTQQYPHFGRHVFVNKGIGSGPLYLHNGAASCGGKSYVSSGAGFSEKELEASKAFTKAEVPCCRLNEIIDEYVGKDDKLLLKLDCEGGDSAIFDHAPSIEAMRRAEYICAEVHEYGLTKEMHETVAAQTKRSLEVLQDTHWVMRTHPMMYARRKR